jgi:Domain of unknown function (DUF6916)
MSYAMVDLQALNGKSFAEHLHTRFKVHAGDSAPIMLELVDVNEPAIHPRIECFTLLFRGPVAPRLLQQIHHFEHEKMGSFDMFVTATGVDAEGTSYEIVFNRLRPTQP